MPEVWYLKQLRTYEGEIKKWKKKAEELEEKLKEKEGRIKILEDELKQMAQRKTSKAPKFSDYSLGRQEKLLTKETFISPGRTPKANKLSEVTRWENVYPEGIPPHDCTLIYSRIITHIREGKKEVVLYHIYKKKWSGAKGVKEQKGLLPQVLPKGEYGVEVGVIVAFLIYTLGLSHTQTRQILSFFCHLEISDSQINALLDQMEKLWEKDFERLCNLVLLGFVVYIDETGWKEGIKRCYAWLFKSLDHTVFLYGEGRSEEVYKNLLHSKVFLNISVAHNGSLFSMFTM